MLTCIRELINFVRQAKYVWFYHYDKSKCLFFFTRIQVALNDIDVYLCLYDFQWFVYNHNLVGWMLKLPFPFSDLNAYFKNLKNVSHSHIVDA
jgi:hypothetical protein